MLTFASPSFASDQKDDLARALTLFKESAAHYEAGRYAVAEALLEEAYALHPEPKLLYNLARAREAGGDIPGAVEAYEAFLAQEPGTENRADVELRVARLKAQLPPMQAPDDQASTEEASDPTPRALPSEESGTAASQPVDQPSSHREPSRVLPWTLLGSGIALLGTGVAFGVLARAEHRDAEDEPVQSEAAKLQDSAERKTLTANILFGAGAALTVSGGAWLWFSRRRSSRASASQVRSSSVRLGLSRIDWIVAY